MKLCSCGSGKNSWWENDARGIPLTRVCEDCKKEKLVKFKPEVLINPHYEADEPIEDEHADPFFDDFYEDTHEY